MVTPEARIKKKIKAILDIYKGRIYVHMPVPYGYGVPTLDYYGAFYGHAFAIEAKAPGKDLTLRQTGTMLSMEAAGMKVFVIDDDETVEQLGDWLNHIDLGRR